MFDPKNRYITCGIDQELPDDIQMLLWLAIDGIRATTDDKLDYLQIFTFQKVSNEILAIKHVQEEPPRVHIHHIEYKEEYRNFLDEKVYVIDDGDHSTMLFAYEY